MNINKMLNDTITSVKSTYNKTNLNPFPKIPEKIEITVKFDIAGTYGDGIDALDKLSAERIQQIVGIFKKHQKTITKLIESELK
jgi:hypothetical protein